MGPTRWMSKGQLKLKERMNGNHSSTAEFFIYSQSLVKQLPYLAGNCHHQKTLSQGLNELKTKEKKKKEGSYQLMLVLDFALNRGSLLKQRLRRPIVILLEPFSALIQNALIIFL